MYNMKMKEKIKLRSILNNDKFMKALYYLFVGACTTLISFLTYKIFLIAGIQYVVAFSASWLIAVTFAYVANRKKTYNSKAKTIKAINFEYLKFIFGRIITYILNLILLVIAVEWFKLDKFYSNVVITILVIILNYYIGEITINKLFVKINNDI